MYWRVKLPGHVDHAHRFSEFLEHIGTLVCRQIVRHALPVLFDMVSPTLQPSVGFLLETSPAKQFAYGGLSL